MKYAIDRIKAGSEKEVQANEFSAMTVIPFRLSRFFCPECGEQVYWRAQGGTHPCQFYHKNKTDTSPECDKRVDGRSDLYVHERVGLPLYLSCHGKTYHLNIGFPAIGDDAITKAASQGIKVIISSSTNSRTVGINQTNFYSDSTTLIPVNFVPPNAANYAITIEGGNWNNRKWADYADGFTYAGAIFTYGETGGKKVRRGDSISPSRKYYVVTKHLLNYYREIQYTLVGDIRLNNEEFRVYIMSIDVATDDVARYSLINSYFKNHYGVWLLETLPEIIPLWPPVVERDSMIPTIRKSHLFFSVLSGNSEPTVYMYNGNNAIPNQVHSDNSKNHTLKLPIYGSELIVSVDRKYVGREVSILNKVITPHGHSYNLSFTKDDGTAFDIEDLHWTDIQHGFAINSNAKLDAVLLSKDFICQQVPLRATQTLIAPLQKLDVVAIEFTVDNAIVFSTRLTEIHQTNDLSEDSLLQLLSKGLCGIHVPVPYWIRLILNKYREQKCYAIVSFIERNIQNNKVPIGLLNVLVDMLES